MYNSKVESPVAVAAPMLPWFKVPVAAPMLPWVKVPVVGPVTVAVPVSGTCAWEEVIWIVSMRSKVPVMVRKEVHIFVLERIIQTGLEFEFVLAMEEGTAGEVYVEMVPINSLEMEKLTRVTEGINQCSRCIGAILKQYV
jgi:hypothetical protein